MANRSTYKAYRKAKKQGTQQGTWGKANKKNNEKIKTSNNARRRGTGSSSASSGGGHSFSGNNKGGNRQPSRSSSGGGHSFETNETIKPRRVETQRTTNRKLDRAFNRGFNSNRAMVRTNFRQANTGAYDKAKKFAGKHVRNIRASVEEYGASKDLTYQSLAKNHLESTGKDKLYKNVDRDKLKKYGGSFDKLRVGSTDTKKIDREIKRDSDRLQKSANIKENIKKDSSKFGKFLWDVEGEVAKMGIDQVTGLGTPAGTFAALGTRAYGPSYLMAKQEGASDKQASIFGLANAGKEIATEKMFGLGGRFMKGYGRGFGDDTVSKGLSMLADKTMQKIGNKTLQNMTYTGLNHLGPIVTEGLEEGVADLVEPYLANFIYANEVSKDNEAKVKALEEMIAKNPQLQTDENRRLIAEMKKSADIRHSFNPKEALYDMAIGGAIGGLSGTSLALGNNKSGSKFKKMYGEDGLSSLAERVSKIDEDNDGSLQAKAISEIIRNGGSVANGQVAELIRADAVQNERNVNTMNTALTAARNQMKDEGLANPYRRIRDIGGNMRDETSEFVKRRVHSNEETSEKALNYVIEKIKADKGNKYQIDTKASDEIKSAVAEIMSGDIKSADTVNIFTTDNPLARAVYEEATGDVLPNSNKETREMLYAKNGENLIKMAEAERSNVIGRIKGITSLEASAKYGPRSVRALSDVFEQMGEDINSDRARDLMTTFENMTRAGAVGIDFDALEELGNMAHLSTTKEQRRAMYDAAVADNGAEALLTNNVVKAGEDIKNVARRLKAEGKTVTGRVLADNLSSEVALNLTDKEMNALTSIAEGFGINVNLVDNAYMGDAKVNGFYDPETSTIYYNVQSDKPMMYVVGHELTHHIKMMAPAEYKKIKDLVAAAWMDISGTSYDNAIESVKNDYLAVKNQKLTDEEALEELIANQMYEVFQSDRFFEKLKNEEPSLARAIMNAVIDVLEKIRDILLNKNRFAPEVVDSLYEQLGILGDVEDLTVKAYTEAMRNKYAASDMVRSEDYARYSVNNKFYKQIDSWDGKTTGFSFEVGKTSNVLKMIGVKDSSIRIHSSKIKAILNKHEGMNKDVIKQIPNVLENPIVVMWSKSTEHRIVMLGNVYDNKGKPVTIVLELLPTSRKGNVLNAIFIATAQGRRSTQGLINGSTILYVNPEKKETNNWLSVNRLQLPLRSSQFGLINKITYNNGVVNVVPINETDSNARFSLKDNVGNELSDAQQEYFKDSKVRDESGNLKDVSNGNEQRYSISNGSYVGRSMSKRAVAAYENGEKPLSKWTKSEIINTVTEIADDEEINVGDISKLTKAELVDAFLDYSSWHHTGALYNRTSFYSVDVDAVRNFDGVDSIIGERNSKTAKSEEQKNAERVNAENVKTAKDIYKRITAIFNSGVTGLRTLKGVGDRIIDGRVTLDEYWNECVEYVKGKDQNKIDNWRRLEDGHPRHDDVWLFDNDIDEYVLKMYADSKIPNNNRMIQEIKNFIDTPINKQATERYSIDYERRERNITRRNEENRAILENSGIEKASEIADFMEELGNIRHKIHTNDWFSVESLDFDEIMNWLYDTEGSSRVDKRLKEIGIPTIKGLPPFSEDVVSSLDIESGMEYEDAREEWSSQVESMNDSIENWMRDFDAKYGTSYTPTGKWRAERFSLSSPVEETGELLAIHNMKPDDLARSLELGGFPMPSIAIVKANQGHEKYGDISLVFNKETINPREKANAVYGGDAWTPTFPKIEYKVNENVQRRVRELYYKIAREHGYDSAKGLQNYANDFEGVLEFNNGELEMIQNAKDDTQLMQTYLVAEGDGKIDDVYKHTETRISEADEELCNVMIDELGEKLINKLKAPEIGLPLPYIKKYINEHLNKIKAAYKKWLLEYVKVDDVTAESMVSDKPDEYYNIVSKLRKYLRNGPVTVKEEYDYKATENAIRNAVKNTNYDKWVEDLFTGAEEKAGIYNGKDIFTDSGNRRSFEQTHDDITLDNIVKAMKLKENGETMLGDSLKAIAQKKYKSISEIKADSGRLKTLTDEEYEKMSSELSEREFEIITRLFDRYEMSTYDNPFIIRSEIGSAIADAVRNGKSKEEMLDILKGYYVTNSATMEDVEGIVNLVEDTANMPTGYFEAKPQRAVGLDEVKAVIIPNDTDEALLDRLGESGMNVVEYESGNSKDRLEKLNSVKDVRFSIDINLSDKDIMSKYGITSLNDYIHVQKQVQKHLPETFYGDVVINSTGDVVRINKKGIKETLGDDNKFKKISHKKKMLKLKTIEYLPELLRTADPADLNVDNYHKSNKTAKYDYYENNVTIDENDYVVKIAVRVGKNSKRFHIHSLEVNENQQGLNLHDFRHGITEFPADDDSIYHSETEVNGGVQKKRLQVDIKPATLDEVNEYVDNHPEEFPDGVPSDLQYQKIIDRKNNTITDLNNEILRLKDEKKLTHGKVLKVSSVRSDFNELVKTLLSGSYKSNKTRNDIVNAIVTNSKTIFKQIKEDNLNDAAETSYYVARELVDSLVIVEDEMFNKYKDFVDELRDTRIVVPKSVKDEIGDYGEFRRDNMGKLKLVNEGGVAIDDYYIELCDEYPELFDSEIEVQADQLLEIANVRESLRPYDMMLGSEEVESLTRQIAIDIMDIVYENGESRLSWADRKKDQYDKRLQKVKNRHEEAMKKLRDDEAKRRERLKDKYKKKIDDNKVAERISREKEIRAIKEKNKEKEQAKKENNKRKQLKKKMADDFSWLSKRCLNPTDKEPMPEVLRRPVAEILCTIDFQSELSKRLMEKTGVTPQNVIKMQNLRNSLEDLAKEDSSYSDVADEGLWQLMREFDKQMDGMSVDEMTNEEIETVAAILKQIRVEVSNMNKLFTMSRDLSEAGEAVIYEGVEYANKYRFKRDGGIINSIFNFSLVSPIDIFRNIGGTMNESFKKLRNGDNKHMDNMQIAKDFFLSLYDEFEIGKKYLNVSKGSKMEDWRNPKKAKEYKTMSGDSVKLTDAQLMSLYCLSKRDQALGHIRGNGIVPAEITIKNNRGYFFGKKTKDIATSKGVILNDLDIKAITSNLSEEQKAIADKMMNFLNTVCADWGNETSLKMFNYKKFTEKNYFPIKSERAFLDTNFEKKANNTIESIKNFGFTKGTQVEANNPIVVDDIFRTVTKHITDMSLYNSFAPAISDFTRLYNYRKTGADGTIESVKSVLETAYGKELDSYVSNFMADLQSQNNTRREGFDDLLNKLLANSKKAAIGFNFRVAIQQPTAIVKAADIINPKYFGKMNHKPNIFNKLSKDDISTIEEMITHCPVARRKAWGFSQTDLAKPMEDIIMNEWSLVDTLTMEIYGALDVWTWSKIWKAVKAETVDKHPDVKVGSDEFFKIVSERATEVYDNTQVVDSVFHRSGVMRNKTITMKTITAFMSEPIRTYNMLRNDILDARKEAIDGNKSKAAKIVFKTTTVFVANAMVLAMAQSIADVIRGKDDDKDEKPDTYFQLLLSNFKSNVNPLNLIPIAKDIASIKDGFGISNMALDGYEKIVLDAIEFTKWINGDSDKSAGELIKKLVEDQSSITGIPVKSFMREVETLLNLFGINAFAAVEGEEPNVIQQIIGLKSSNLFGKDKKNDEGEAEENDIDYGIYERPENSLVDNINNLIYKASSGSFGTDPAIRKQRKRDEQLKDNAEMLKGMSTDDAYRKATSGYTKIIEAGDMQTIREMRKVINATGNEDLITKFNNNLEKALRSQYKKNIGDDTKNVNMRNQIGSYLTNSYGYSEFKISEIVMRSDTAKEFQKYAALGEKEKAQELAYELGNAGLTQNDLDKLWQRRWNSIDAETTGTFAMPASGRVTSRFGGRWGTLHAGIDIAMPTGTEVKSADGGTVISVGYKGALGKYIDVRHDNGYITRYQHLSWYDVERGQKVKKGQYIGKSGNTGNSTGPHLHFAVYHGSRESDTTHANAINPEKFINF